MHSEQIVFFAGALGMSFPHLSRGGFKRGAEGAMSPLFQ